MSDLYECDRCGTEVTLEDVGFLGSENEECSPFVELDCFCTDCTIGNEETHNTRRAPQKQQGGI